ncbi:MAG: LTA synthase family protein [Bacteroidaceae bacterium]|nr:LTA synthase family protein [Bacteroidaceae bacterium]
MQKNNATASLLTLYTQLWSYQLIGLAIFVIARILHLTNSVSTETILQHSDSAPLFLWNSWRFDIQAITYISLPMILGTLVTSFLKVSIINRTKRAMRWYFSIMYAILSAIVCAEFFFYNNFNSRYNVVFFDFFDEGPLGLLQTMWQEYPVIKILLGILIIAFTIFSIGKYIKRIKIKKRRWMNTVAAIIACVLIAGVTFIFMRGSVTRYTLQVEAFMVSTDDNINQSVPNAIYLLKKANKERRKSFALQSDESLLQKAGFSNIDEAIEVAALAPAIGSNNEEKVKNALFAKAAGTEKSPNVVVILNESWSRFLLEIDKGENPDLLCSLRSHIADDLLFGNIQSVRNGTIYSLESVTLAMPYDKFFNSRYRFRSFNSSIAHPFKESGYATSFITGMDPTWENVQEGLSYQSFDTIIGRQNILQAIKNSTTSAIGVYDEFLYEYIEEHLDRGEKSGKPQFILALTTTNHPPFTYPDNMQLPPLTDEWYSSPYLTGDKEVLRKYGTGAQYANKCLGDFLTKLKASPHAENTIILVTGDHNVRSIINYDKVPQKYMCAVPLYMYLPQSLRNENIAKKEITERYGSHYDILPTLAPLCIKENVEYLAIGNNLLDTTKSNNDYYSYNEKQLLLPDETKKDSIAAIIDARKLLMKIYYQQGFRETSNKK